MDVTCTLDTSCDHLLHLDSPSLSSKQQDTSSVENVEIKFLPESEGKLDHTNLSPTGVLSGHHGYELFLLQKEIDAPNGNLNHQHIHNCENQDDILIHAPILSHTFALPQLMAEHNCEDLEPTDAPSTVPIAIQATCDHTFNPKCAHNLMETQCNQPQYLIPLNKICAHIPTASQNNQVSLSNCLASPYQPDPGEHVLKRSATATDKQDFPVKWFKFIHPSP